MRRVYGVVRIVVCHLLLLVVCYCLVLVYVSCAFLLSLVGCCLMCGVCWLYLIVHSWSVCVILCGIVVGICNCLLFIVYCVSFIVVGDMLCFLLCCWLLFCVVLVV